MRAEQSRHGGRWLLCGVILKAEKIKPGQIWAPADDTNDRTVRIESIDADGWLTYSFVERGELYPHARHHFNFQCRYCLVLSSGDIPAEFLPELVRPQAL